MKFQWIMSNCRSMTNWNHPTFTSNGESRKPQIHNKIGFQFTGFVSMILKFNGSNLIQENLGKEQEIWIEGLVEDPVYGEINI